MAQVKVELSDHSYNIHIAANLLNSNTTTDLFPVSQQYAIVSNEKVADLYLASLKSILPSNSKVVICLIPDTEQSKSSEQYLLLLDKLLSENFNRSSTIIALGGGVVGDLAGFVASTLHRGCHFVQVPTTLLAQVDSSVGGKTAINHSSGKNLIGTFYQPKVVIIDPEALKTLDSRQFSAGMAEVIKYAFLHEQSFLPWLENNKEGIANFNDLVLEEMIAHCCTVKAAIVSMDEREKGQRALLNFGHTFAHAIETSAGYGSWLHGEAVAVGMLMASKLAVDNKLMDNEFYLRLQNLLLHFNLPTKISENFDAQQLLKLMYRDKKNLAGDLKLVLPRGAGNSELLDWQDDDNVLMILRDFGASN